MEELSGKSSSPHDFKFSLHKEENEFRTHTGDPGFCIQLGSPSSQHGSVLSEYKSALKSEFSSENIIAYKAYTPDNGRFSGKEDSTVESTLKNYVRELESDCENYKFQTEQLKSEIRAISSDYGLLKKQVAEQRQKDSTKLVALIELVGSICGEEATRLSIGGNFEQYLNCLSSKLEIVRCKMIRLSNEGEVSKLATGKSPFVGLVTTPEVPSTFLSEHTKSGEKPGNLLSKTHTSPSSKLLVDLRTGLSTCTSSIARLQQLQYLKQKYAISPFKL